MTEQIFDIASLQCKQDKNKVTYCDFLDQDDYIAQFINAEDVNFFVEPKNYDEPVVEIMASEDIEDVNEEEEKISGETREEKKRYTFHNFQKHLVTTIRSVVDRSKLAQNQQTAQCEKKIWRIFCNSSKINKTLVSMVMGDLTEEHGSKIYEYGFREIIRDFKPHIIKKAQKNICEETMRQLKQANFENELVGRRMKHKKEFIIYFEAFMEELVNGELDKRMAKCTKLLKNE